MTSCEQAAALEARAIGLNEPRFEDRGDMLLVGLNSTYTMDTRAAIPLQWDKFVPLIRRIDFQSDPRDSFGVSWNFRRDSSFDYLTGVLVTYAENLPIDMTRLCIKASRYAIFSHSEHISQFPETIDTIWKQWVPRSQLKIAQTPCVERYTKEFDPKVRRGGVEIWIPLAN